MTSESSAFFAQIKPALFALCFPYLVPITLFIAFGSIIVLCFPSTMDGGEGGVSGSSAVGAYGLIVAPLAGALTQIILGLPSNLMMYLIKSETLRIAIAGLQSIPLMFIIVVFGSEPETGLIGFACNVVVSLILISGSMLVYKHVKVRA